MEKEGVLTRFAGRYDRRTVAVVVTYLFAFVWFRRVAVPVILLVLFGAFSDMYIPVLLGWAGTALLFIAPLRSSSSVRFRLHWIGFLLLATSWLFFFFLSDVKWVTVIGSLPFLGASIWSGRLFARERRRYLEEGRGSPQDR